MDMCAALLGLIVLSPLFLLLYVVGLKQFGRPVLFTQVRPGRNSKLFTMYKFRTMRNAIGSDGLPLPDADRLTRYGRILRATSLDELPELWNVLIGDMSVVGPRPLLEAYLPLYSPEQAKRHLVRPGLTGLAQVSGRNALTWEEKFAFDVKYVESMSLRMDVEIFVKTFKSVLKRQGISASDSATMSAFEGSASA